MPPPARCSNHRCIYIDQCENKDQETPYFPCLVIFGRLDNVQIKQTSYHIRNAVKCCVKTRYLNGKIHNGRVFILTLAKQNTA